jgi:large subunit ribosomal protein L30
MPGKKAARTHKTSVSAFKRTQHDGKKSGGTVKIKWVVSFISCTDDMRQTIRGLGLRRMHQVVERQDTPETRGMIHKVRHLVEVVE